jgi:hypothetical protein
MDILRGKDLYSTGSYGKDVGVGLMSALQNAFNKPNKYYVSANYMGNGLARTGIEGLKNPNYVNPYDYMNALTSSLYGNNKESGFIDSLKQRFQDDNKPMFQLDTIYKYPLKTQEYKMPQLGNIGGNVIGGTQGAYDNMYTLPTQQLNFNKFWE